MIIDQYVIHSQKRTDSAIANVRALRWSREFSDSRADPRGVGRWFLDMGSRAMFANIGQDIWLWNVGNAHLTVGISTDFIANQWSVGVIQLFDSDCFVNSVLLHLSQIQPSNSSRLPIGPVLRRQTIRNVFGPLTFPNGGLFRICYSPDGVQWQERCSVEQSLCQLGG